MLAPCRKYRAMTKVRRSLPHKVATESRRTLPRHRHGHRHVLYEVLEDPPVERRHNNCSQIFSTSTRPCEKPVPRCRCPVGLWAGRASSLLHQSFYVVIHLHVFNQLSSFYCLKSCRGLIPLLAPKVADQHHSAMSLDNLMTPAWLKLTMRYGRCHRTT
jgi:hypothetical protein